MEASSFSNTTALMLSLLAREKSVRFFSVVVPDCTHTVAPLSCLALVILPLLGTMKPWPS
ncbi:hypothetical protein D9M68_914980 [compost metagenome]